MKWNDPHLRRQMNHPLWEGQTTRGTSSSQTPFSCERSISTKEKEGPPKRTPSLDKPSPIAIACLKIEIAYAHCNIVNTFYL
jgi:hypothetical protein